MITQYKYCSDLPNIKCCASCHEELEEGNNELEQRRSITNPDIIWEVCCTVGLHLKKIGEID